MPFGLVNCTATRPQKLRPMALALKRRAGISCASIQTRRSSSARTTVRGFGTGVQFMPSAETTGTYPHGSWSGERINPLKR